MKIYLTIYIGIIAFISSSTSQRTLCAKTNDKCPFGSCLVSERRCGCSLRCDDYPVSLVCSMRPDGSTNTICGEVMKQCGQREYFEFVRIPHNLDCQQALHNESFTPKKFCENQSFCFNKGICFYNRVSNEKTCICKYGFEGERCNDRRATLVSKPKVITNKHDQHPSSSSLATVVLYSGATLIFISLIVFTNQRLRNASEINDSSSQPSEGKVSANHNQIKEKIPDCNKQRIQNLFADETHKCNRDDHVTKLDDDFTTSLNISSLETTALCSDVKFFLVDERL